MWRGENDTRLEEFTTRSTSWCEAMTWDVEDFVSNKNANSQIWQYFEVKEEEKKQTDGFDWGYISSLL